jgi:hypothetical protein
MVRTPGKSLAFLLVLAGSVYAQPKCLNSIRELKENNVKTKWYETTADDGKPMRIFISGNHGLTFQAIKAGDVWLRGDLAPKFYPIVSSLLAVGLPCRTV